MHLLQAIQCQLQPRPKMTFDLPRINQPRELLQYVMMGFDINMVVWLSPQKTPDKRHRLGHEVGAVHVGLALDDRADLTEGSADLAAGGHVLVCRGRDEYVSVCLCKHGVRWLVFAERRLLEWYVEVEFCNLRRDILSMVHDVSCSHLLGEFSRLRPRGSGYNTR